MATAYTSNVGLQKPGTTDRNWDVPINANSDTLDGLTAIGALATTVTEYPSTTLRVHIASGNFLRSDGTIGQFAGVPSFTVTVGTVTYLWLTDNATLNSGAAFPATAHVRLAKVTAGTTSITSIVDQRIQCATAGPGLGFVLKAGDTISGLLTIATPMTGTPLAALDPIGRAIGFFGVTPATQAQAIAALTDATNGTVSATVADVGATYSQAQINANLASLTAKVNALILALKRHGLMST